MNELNKLLSIGFGKSEIGFVMGEILIAPRNLAEASRLYSEILNDDANFPEVHDRLSFIYAENGDTESALTEAKAPEPKRCGCSQKRGHALFFSELRRRGRPSLPAA